MGFNNYLQYRRISFHQLLGFETNYFIIIHHIQSFLNARDQTQTSVLAKSWYISCATRPVLVFDENDYSPKGSKGVLPHEFSEFCTETLKVDNTLKVDKFTLIMKTGKGWGMTEQDFYLRNKLAGELIISALEIGVREIELKLDYYADFRLRNGLSVENVVSTSLIRLFVDRYVIDRVLGDRVFCSRLKSLVLDNVKTMDDIVRDILSRSPMIENLDLCLMLRVDEFIGLDRMKGTEFRFLRQLQLENVKIGGEFFTEFGPMFPYSEHLTLGYFGDYEEISISSHSATHIILRFSLLEWETLKKVQLNVPNISKFRIEAGTGDINIERKFRPLPSISFDNVSRDWDSHVELCWRCDVIDASWFSDLRRFLIQMNLSRISMFVRFFGNNVVPGEEIPCYTDIPVVEKLNVCACCSWNMKDSLLLGLSRSCRSNMISVCGGCMI